MNAASPQRPQVLITGPLPIFDTAGANAVVLHKLWEMTDWKSTLAKLGPDIRGVAAGGSMPIDGALLDRLPKVEIVASFGVGYDKVDTSAARKRNVIVTNTPDVLTEEVADLALALLITTLRDLGRAEQYLRAGSWTKAAFPLTNSLRGRTVGIVGLGRIGKAIARRLEASAVKVAYHGRKRQAGVSYPYFATAVELAHAVDTLMIVAPGGPETDKLIDKTVLAALGPQGVLINVARGSLVDEPALIEALKSGTIAAAGLDVFAKEPNVPSELLELQNVVLLPHVGSGSVVTRNAMGQLVLDNLVSWFKGQGPLTPVPETPWVPKP